MIDFMEEIRNNLPKGFRFVSYHGIQIFQPLETNGSPKSYLECILCAGVPDDISDETLGLTFREYPNKVIRIDYPPFTMSNKEVMNVFRNKIKSAISGLQQYK